MSFSSKSRFKKEIVISFFVSTLKSVVDKFDKKPCRHDLAVKNRLDFVFVKEFPVDLI